MVEIRIVSGVAAVHPNGQCKAVRNGETVTTAEDEAAELVGLGVAVYTKEPVLVERAPYKAPETGNNNPEKNDEPEEPVPKDLKTPDGIPAHLDPDDLQEMTFANLKKLATDMGLPVNKLRSKQAIIDALTEETVFVDPQDEVPPVVEADGPVV
ncbi:MAG: hypothetical protein J5915_02555 [Acidaminococcaceae bacterium]|nr:hypothetical protein [Acidaminococcaceae bacterium]MBQ5344914.1 hypothetical protein [Acidaminococcaceae bacterium]